jgi:hypothetical protein
MKESDLVVLCAADGEYLPYLESGTLETPAMLAIAGMPDGQEIELRQAGVYYFIHLKADMLRVLTSMHNHLWS